MKNILKVMALFMLMPTMGYSLDASFIKTGGSEKTVLGTLANEDGLTYNRNYYLNTSVYEAEQISSVITFSTVTFANVSFSTNNYATPGTITSVAHGLTMGVPVLLRATAGIIPPPLVAETTYYAFPITADTFKISTTAAKAQISDPIIWGSSKPANGTQTYTFIVPTTYVGTLAMIYYGSNDGVNFFSLSKSSSVATMELGTYVWPTDFSYYNYNTLKLSVTSPTTGAIKLKADVSMKRK